MQVSTRQTQALAASVVALVIAAPFAFQHVTKSGVPDFGTVTTELKNAVSQGGSSSSVLVQAPSAPRAELATVAKQKQDDGRVSVPIDINRKDLALKGADPGSPREGPPEPSLGAVGGSYGAGAPPMPPALVQGRQSAPQPNPAMSIAAPPPSRAEVPIASGLGGPYASRDRIAGLSGEVRRAPKVDLDGVLGQRTLEHDASAAASATPSKPNAYAWMGHADEQKVTALEGHRDKFSTTEINPVKQVASEPVSTFSIDVDTASYAFVRRALNAGHLPPKDAVRVEEMINYFPYAYAAPETAETPFKPTVTVMPSPWNANTKLVHVAIKGYDLKTAERPRANLVLLMDVSGSMAPADRLPLIKTAFRMLVDQLKPDDTVGIVTYASGSGIALEPTKVSNKAKILNAIDKLDAGGSTAGAAGIADAYRLAEAGFDQSAVNRVILATDGDFNVGITDQSALKGFIERKRQSGVFLSILGVGQGNHNDALMQTLAQNGNGTAAYADTLNEARKVLVDEASSSLFTIAKDFKVQIEWNPARVAEYRLVGYETRALRREDFNNDRVDAGDIGSGHTVTAIYEVTPVGSPQLADSLRYGRAAAKEAAPEPAKPEAATASELGFLKLRYKRPNDDTSQLISLAISSPTEGRTASEASSEVRFSVAAAAFGQLLKAEPYLQGFGFDDVLALAQSARGDDPFGYRAEFLSLVRLAKSAQP